METGRQEFIEDQRRPIVLLDLQICLLELRRHLLSLLHSVHWQRARHRLYDEGLERAKAEHLHTVQKYGRVLVCPV